MSRNESNGTVNERTKFSWPVVLVIVTTALGIYIKVDQGDAAITKLVTDSNQQIAEKYETKADHEADIEKINQSSQKLWEGQHALSTQLQVNHEQTQLAIQILTDAVNQNKNKN
jgi:hypothetical protein